MTKPRVAGVVTALVTPLKSGGGFDGAGMERLVENQVLAGIDAIFILGSVGEGPLLPDQVSDDVARCAARSLDRRRPLLAGASDNSVDRCLERLERLAQAGVNFGVVTLPYYGWPARTKESVEFFASLAARSPIPLVAYNLPKAVGWQMPLETIEELYDIPNLVCLKDTHGNFDQMAAVAGSPRRPKNFTYLPGNSLFAARLFRAGADGVVTTPANLYPRPFVDLWRFHREGRPDLVDLIDRELISRMGKMLDLLPNAAGAIKAALELRGICLRHTVRPWPEADEGVLQALRPLLAETDRAVAQTANEVVRLGVT